MVEVVLFDGSSYLSLTFFNQPWRTKQLSRGHPGRRLRQGGALPGPARMTNPVVDLVGDRTGRIVPVYPQSEKAGLSSWEIGDWVSEALRRARPFGDPLPEPWRRRLELPDRDWAMHQIHAPDSMADSQMARRRLAFDELLRLQLILVMRKRAVEREAAGIRHRVDGELVDRFRAGLPFHPDRSPGAGHRRDPAPTWPDRTRCTGCCRATSGRARPSWRWRPCSRPSRAATRAP